MYKCEKRYNLNLIITELHIQYEAGLNSLILSMAVSMPGQRSADSPTQAF